MTNFLLVTVISCSSFVAGHQVLLGLGGWNDSRSTKYSRLVADAGRRRKFVDEVVKLLLEYGFDGLDLDWEYPGYEGNSADKQGEGSKRK